MYVYIYMYRHICIDTWKQMLLKFINNYVHMCVYTLYIHACMYIYAYIYISLSVYIHVCIYIDIDACVYAHVYTYI